MTIYVLSTMTNSVMYRSYKLIGANVQNGSGPLPVPVPGGTLIFGGAGLPSDKSGDGEMTRDHTGVPIWTAVGVITAVSDEKYEKLKEHWLFKKHMEHGYLKVLDHDITGNNREIRRIVENDMQPHDGFAQLSKANFKERIKISTPTTGLSQDRADHDSHDSIEDYRR